MRQSRGALTADGHRLRCAMSTDGEQHMSRMTRLLLVIIVATAASLIAAGSALAIAMPCYIEPGGISHCPGPVTTQAKEIFASDQPGYIGWASIRSDSGYGFACPANALNCTGTSGWRPVTAYRWSAGAWHATTIAHGTSVYAYPYGSGWEWVWTSRTGWLATRANRVYIRTIQVSCIVNGVNTCPQLM